MRGLIALVNENHVDNNLKEILVYVYFGSIQKAFVIYFLCSSTPTPFWKGSKGGKISF